MNAKMKIELFYVFILSDETAMVTNQLSPVNV